MTNIQPGVSRVKALQTTPAICQQALGLFSPMEQGMCADAWIAQDALATHELLALVRDVLWEVDVEDMGTKLHNRLSEWAKP